MTIKPEPTRDVAISLDRIVTVGPGISDDPGIWMLTQFPLTRWMTPADARSIANALLDAANDAEAREADRPYSRRTKKG